LWDKDAEWEGRGETETEREPGGEGKGTGKENSALVAGIDASASGVRGRVPAEKRISCIYASQSTSG